VAARRLAARKKGALAAGATVIFIDETGFSQRPNLRRSWGPEGQTPVLKEHFNWKKLSAIGAVAWRSNEATTRLFLSPRPGSISTPEVVEFLRNLRRHVAGPVVVVWDRLGAHRSGLTMTHVTAQAKWLRVEYFPAYAPELNPLEYLWATFKGKDVANYPADSIAELDDHLRRSVRRVRRRTDMGLSFIKHAGLISEDEYLQLCKGQ
jgi:transposase